MPPRLPKDTVFTKGKYPYKYRVKIPSKDVSVQFGRLPYEHYKDQTPAKLWKSKDHLDGKRRKQYRARSSKQKTKSGEFAYKQRYSPAWFSYHFLW